MEHSPPVLVGQIRSLRIKTLQEFPVFDRLLSSLTLDHNDTMVDNGLLQTCQLLIYQSVSIGTCSQQGGGEREIKVILTADVVNVEPKDGCAELQNILH